MSPRSTDRFGDDGSVLVIALVVLIVISLIVFGLLTQATANLKVTSIVRSRTDRTFAADAGAEWARDQIRFDPARCPSDPAAALPAQVQNYNNRNVTVQCSPQVGSDLGIAGWAAIVRGTFSLQGGGTMNVKGPVYANNIDFTSNGGGELHDSNGNVFQHYSVCNGQVGDPRITFDAGTGFHWACTQAAPPDPTHVLTSAPAAPVSPLPILAPGNKCLVFGPGKYTTSPDALASTVLSLANIHNVNDYYFASGLYYFEGIGTWNVPNGTTVTGGGAPDPSGNCAGVSDANAPPLTTVNGTGVEFVFGGASSMNINSAVVNLYSRAPGAGDTSTPGISLYAVPSNGNGYLGITSQSPPSSPTLLTLTTGNAGSIIQGNTYSPTADIVMFASNNTTAAFQGGLVANNFTVTVSNAATGIDIRFNSSTHARSVLVTVTAPSSGEGDTVADVRMQIRDDTSPATLVVLSWRTCARGAVAATNNPVAPYPSPGCP